MDSAAGSTGKMGKNKKKLKTRKKVPTGFWFTSLTWDAILSMEAELSWAPIQNSGWVDTAWQDALH